VAARERTKTVMLNEKVVVKTDPRAQTVKTRNKSTTLGER